MKLGHDTGSLINHIYSRVNSAAPVVGDGATILAWSDRYAGTIIDVRADGSFTVQEDSAVRGDTNGMSDSQSYIYSPNPDGRKFVFAPVRRGKAKGQIREDGNKDGYGVIIGRRDKHYDYSF